MKKWKSCLNIIRQLFHCFSTLVEAMRFERKTLVSFRSNLCENCGRWKITDMVITRWRAWHSMTHHHQGAIAMSKLGLTKSQNDELKKFTQKIIDDQQIAQMKDWREKWFSGKSAALNMEMQGMTDSMKMMAAGGMRNLEAKAGKDFDLLFLEMMIPHHAGAVTMANEALQKSGHPEIKTLSGNIIKAQEAEIKMMNDWKAKWEK